MDETQTNTPYDDFPYGIAPSGYRLPTTTRLGRIRLQVADLGRSVAFYERVLGFHLLDRSNGRASLGSPRSTRASSHLSAEHPATISQPQSPLLELHEHRGAHKAPRNGLLGLYHFAILLPTRADLGRFIQHISELGVHAGMADHAVSEAVYLSDPDGLGIEVYIDRPRDTWTHAGRELVMTTLPLKAREVAHAGGGHPWTGLPVETRIGHVHLHVGDLPTAESFYHQGLGFDKTVWNYPGALFFGAGGYHHHVGTNTWAGTVPSAGNDDAKLLDWEIVLPDAESLDAVVDNMGKLGYPTTRQDTTEVIAQDPWGTGVRIVSAPIPQGDM